MRLVRFGCREFFCAGFTLDSAPGGPREPACERGPELRYNGRPGRRISTQLRRTLKPPGPMIGAGGWGVVVELFWAAARYRLDDGFVGEVQLSAVWPDRASRGLAQVRAGNARGAFGGR
jgi:hypothetical protein